MEYKTNKPGKLTDEDAKEIIKILKYTYRSYESIGKQYNVEVRTISHINKGICHKQEDEEYPIRDWRATSKPCKLTYEQVTEINNLLLTTDLSLREIARRYNVLYVDILHIKNGSVKPYRRKELVYPLRSNN